MWWVSPWGCSAGLFWTKQGMVLGSVLEGAALLGMTELSRALSIGSWSHHGIFAGDFDGNGTLLHILALGLSD